MENRLVNTRPAPLNDEKTLRADGNKKVFDALLRRAVSCEDDQPKTKTSDRETPEDCA